MVLQKLGVERVSIWRECSVVSVASERSNKIRAAKEVVSGIR